MRMNYFIMTESDIVWVTHTCQKL